MELSRIEIIDIAKQIETFGVAFYDEAAKRAKSAAVRKLFEHLRNEERNHEGAFETLLTNMVDPGYEWRQSDEYLAYMSALAEKMVFPAPEVARQMAAALTDERAALNRAIDFEKESIVYFGEMRKAVREQDSHILDQLIEEERKHLELLTNQLARTTA